MDTIQIHTGGRHNVPLGEGFGHFVKKCQHCREHGGIDYQYVGLPFKIKRWYGNPEKCSDVLDQ